MYSASWSSACLDFPVIQKNRGKSKESERKRSKNGRGEDEQERETERMQRAKKNEEMLGEDMGEERKDGKQEGKKREVRWELSKGRGQQMKGKRMEMRR